MSLFDFEAFFDLVRSSDGSVVMQFTNNPSFNMLQLYGWKFVGLTTTPAIIKMRFFDPITVKNIGNVASSVIPLRFNGSATVNIGNEEPYCQYIKIGGKSRVADIKVDFLDEDNNILDFTRVYLWFRMSD